VAHDHGLRQVVVPPHLWPLITTVMDMTGQVLVRLPDDLLDDDLPTYVVHPRHLPERTGVTPPAVVVE
jgi:hypothetical protein